MKRKWYFLLLAAAITGTMFVACSDDDDDETDNSLIKSYSSLTVGAQDNPTIGSFLSLGNGTVYTLAQTAGNKSAIDIFCFYEEGNDMALSSPGGGISGIYMQDSVEIFDSTWNFTGFSQTDMSVARFDAIATPDSIVAQFTGTARRKASRLVANNIYAFKTQDAKYGLFKVISTTGEEAGSITFAVKMQK